VTVLDCRTCSHAQEWAPGHFNCQVEFPAWALARRRPVPHIWVEGGRVLFDRADYGPSEMTRCGLHQPRHEEQP